jgi:NDMA-dependent alcohol dehydrogenase
MRTPTRAAVVWQAPGKYEVTDLLVDDPLDNEVQVKMVAAGLCHSDDHVATGDMPAGTYPVAGGHEGAGIITKAGRNSKGLNEGDHVIFSFLPVCGHCRWCATGMSQICDNGAGLMSGKRFSGSQTPIMVTPDGAAITQMTGLATFAEVTTVSADNIVKVDDDVPLDKAVLLGCGVGTGWGSAVYAGEVRPGQTVIVMGVGGVGIHAVQGARYAGASHVIAVDPVAFKRDTALQTGATHAFASIAEAAETARQLTNGQGADAAIVTVGVLTGEDIAQAVSATRKAGITVVSAIPPYKAVGIPLPLAELVLYRKRIQGALFGNSNPMHDIRLQLELYRQGALKIDELITSTYSLDEIARGYQDMHDGRNIRGVIVFPG